MSVKEIKAPNVDIYSKLGYYPLIGIFIKGKLTVDSLPIPVVLIDLDSNNKYDFELITVLPFDENIPEVISIMFGYKNAFDFEVHLLNKIKVQKVNKLALYTYAIRSSNTN